MFRRLTFSLSLLLLLVSFSTASAQSRIKDITTTEGLRDNQLSGLGIVTGLAGSGDQDLDMTNQQLQNLLLANNINIPLDDVESENVAVVMVNANIPPNATAGTRLDVHVTSYGDADSLQGGYLLQTPLMGADGVVYAVAEGPLAVGGFLGGDTGAGGATVQKNHPTHGMVTDGAIVEREIPANIINRDGSINIILRNPDRTTAVRIADAINNIFPGSSQALNETKVNILVPQSFYGQETNFMAQIDRILVEPDVPARIIINERNGTIIATKEVKLSPVTLSYGSLVINIERGTDVFQPLPFGGEGETVEVETAQTEVIEQQGGFRLMGDQNPEDMWDPNNENYTSLQDLTNALNSLGVTTRDMINILQSLKNSGALQAELVIQ